MVFATLIDLGGIVATLALFALAIFLLVRAFSSFQEKEKAEKKVSDELNGDDILSICNSYTTRILDLVPEMLGETISALHNEDRKALKKLREQAQGLLLETKNRKNHFTLRLRGIDESSLEYGHFYLQMLHYIREFSHSLDNIIESCHEHVENTHCGTNRQQHEELIKLQHEVSHIFSTISNMVKKQDFKEKEPMKQIQEKLLDEIVEFQKNQVKRIKKNETNTRNSVLYMTMLTGTKDLLVDVIRLLKVQSKFNPVIPYQ